MQTVFSKYILPIWLALAIALTSSGAFAANKESLLKAAFIYRFVHFLQWPEPKTLKRKVPGDVNICILGRDDAAEMRAVFTQATKKSKGLRNYKLKEKFNWSDSGSDCHILFIGNSQKGNLGSILADLKNQPVLTVSDISGFARQGGMIEFVGIDNKVKVSFVNNASAKRAGIYVSPALLEVALSVISE